MLEDGAVVRQVGTELNTEAVCSCETPAQGVIDWTTTDVFEAETTMAVVQDVELCSLVKITEFLP